MVVVQPPALYCGVVKAVPESIKKKEHMFDFSMVLCYNGHRVIGMVGKVLRDSLDRSWVVTIMYQKGGEITQRNIEVKSINGNHITAYCHLRHQTRMFSIDNILSAAYCKKILH